MECGFVKYLSFYFLNIFMLMGDITVRVISCGKKAKSEGLKKRDYYLFYFLN